MGVMAEIHADLEGLKSDKDAAWDRYDILLAAYDYQKRNAEQWREIEKAHSDACWAKHKYDMALTGWKK